MAYNLEGAIARIAKCLIQVKEPQGLVEGALYHRSINTLEVALEINPDEFFVSFKEDTLEGPCGKGKTMKDALIQFAGQLDDDPLYKERT